MSQNAVVNADSDSDVEAVTRGSQGTSAAHRR
jgi:hypothetical protein